MTRVEVLDDHDARVVAELPIELAMSDVERDDPGGATLQQHVSESARGRPDVQRLSSRDVDTKHVEGMRQLETAPPDVRMVGHDERDVGAGSTCAPALAIGWPSTDHLRGQDQRARAAHGWGEAAVEYQLVETNLGMRFVNSFSR
jgi:hypothetical protein